MQNEAQLRGDLKQIQELGKSLIFLLTLKFCKISPDIRQINLDSQKLPVTSLTHGFDDGVRYSFDGIVFIHKEFSTSPILLHAAELKWKEWFVAEGLSSAFSASCSPSLSRHFGRFSASSAASFHTCS